MPEHATDVNRIAYLGLGSNLGQRKANLEQALELIPQPKLILMRVSAFLESNPVGPVPDQPDFINAVAEISTTLMPRELLYHCLSIEKTMGRKRKISKGPRNIDIDLLLMEELIIDSLDLTLPHPELTKRSFVLGPLLELAPELVDPRSGKLLKKCR